MDLNDIITSLLALISGGALSTLVTLGVTRKKAEAEVDNVNAMTTMAITDKLMTYSNDYRDLTNKYAKMESEAQAKGNYICFHLGCDCRMPPQGKANFEWDDSLKKSDMVDYTRIDVLYKTLLEEQANAEKNNKK